MGREHLTELWKLPTSASGYRNLFKDSATLRDMAFFHSPGFVQILEKYGKSWNLM